MGKIIDLGTIVKEPLIFEGCPDGNTYEIPGGISTDFVLTVQKLQGDIQSGMSEEESIDKLFDILVMVLNLDKTKSVDKAYAKKHFDNIKIINVIIDSVMKHINDISNDLN